ncbi:MAG TPA: tetratricopeptide repeat protein [Longimicrobium sp.]|nr:tetratricopeptide repeat protein [Longimicrobium sp.]
MPVSLPQRPARPPARRRVRVPPAVTRGPETLAAAGILDEVRGDLGVLLWRSLRNVSLWTATPEGRRAGLFAGGAADVREAEVRELAVEPELVAPLSVLVRLLENPAGMDLERVVNACRRVAGWAEQRGALATALEYTQAAALAVPESAALAYAVGRLARRRAEYDRAESWYTRAIVQSRRAGDWQSYARAFSGLGNLFVQKGNFPAAARAHRRCLRSARRHCLRELGGDALHDLFVLAFETRDGENPEGYARAALAAYGPGHRKLPRLAYDIAYYWTLEGRFGPALRVVSAILPHMGDMEERMVVWGAIARAAGGMGDARRYRSAAEETWRMAGTETATDAAARALLGVAHGAASLGEWDEAERALQGALGYATERQESKIRLTAEAMLDFVHTRRRTQLAPAAAAEESESLAADLIRALAPLAGESAVLV